jgi:hypothetical protein
VIALQVAAIVVGSLAVLAGVVFGLLWIELRIDARRRRREEMDARLRDMFQAEADRHRRFVHGKTVAEILAEDPEAAAQLARDLDADTDAWTEAKFRVIAYHLRRDVLFRLRLRAAARETRSKT